MATFQLFFQSGRAKDLSASLYIFNRILQTFTFQWFVINGKSCFEYWFFFVCFQDELKVMEEVKAKQEKEDDKKCEESESGSVSLKSPGKVRWLY